MLQRNRDQHRRGDHIQTTKQYQETKTNKSTQCLVIKAIQIQSYVNKFVAILLQLLYSSI